MSESAPNRPSPRILFFSPYAAWRYHTALEATWGHALRIAGADVRFVLCNALSGACDVYRANLNPRTETSCLECQAKCAMQFADLAMPYEWLGGWLDPDDRHRAEQWASGLERDELLSATWRGLAVGSFAHASICTQWRTESPDLGNPEVDRTVRAFLAGTATIAAATARLLDDLEPDTIVLLNGRFFAHWTAIELARQRGIRIVTHERGLRADTVRFAEGARLHELASMRSLWEVWGSVPLNGMEFKHATSILEERRLGKNFSRLSFSPPEEDPGEVRARLGLDERPLVAVFNSSDDETAAFPERRRGAFPEPRDFLPAVLDLAQRRPDLQFVIRLHPNIAKERVGTNQGALAHGLEIERNAPENLLVLHPNDPTSSYTVADLARVAMVYASTIGLEIAASGTPVLCMAQATYSHTAVATPVDSPASLEAALDAALAEDPDGETARRRARTALRWVYRYFQHFAIPFDLVHEEPGDSASLTYSHLAALAPGRHATLDAIRDYLFWRPSEANRAAPLGPLPAPTEGELARGPEQEDLALSRWLSRRSAAALRGRGPAPRVA